MDIALASLLLASLAALVAYAGVSQRDAGNGWKWMLAWIDVLFTAYLTL